MLYVESCPQAMFGKRRFQNKGS